MISTEDVRCYRCPAVHAFCMHDFLIYQSLRRGQSLQRSKPVNICLAPGGAINRSARRWRINRSIPAPLFSRPDIRDSGPNNAHEKSQSDDFRSRPIRAWGFALNMLQSLATRNVWLRSSRTFSTTARSHDKPVMNRYSRIVTQPKDQGASQAGSN